MLRRSSTLALLSSVVSAAAKRSTSPRVWCATATRASMVCERDRSRDARAAAEARATSSQSDAMSASRSETSAATTSHARRRSASSSASKGSRLVSSA